MPTKIMIFRPSYGPAGYVLCIPCKGVASGGSPPEFWSSVNLIPTQGRGVGLIMPTTILLAPSDLKTYLHLCGKVKVKWVLEKK